MDYGLVHTKKMIMNTSRCISCISTRAAFAAKPNEWKRADRHIQNADRVAKYNPNQVGLNQRNADQQSRVIGSVPNCRLMDKQFGIDTKLQMPRDFKKQNMETKHADRQMNDWKRT